MNQKTIFTPVKHKSEDGAYEFYLNSPFQEDVRILVDEMYSEVESYIGDSNFQDMLQTDFHSAVWQLYVTWTYLKKSGLKLLKANSKGPDVVLEDGTIIEAVIAKRGNGPDKPFSWQDETPISDNNGIKLYHPRAMTYPDPQIVMRITQAIESKKVQYESWIQAGIIKAEQPFIVAVNAGLLDEAKDAFGRSYGARVAFALGRDVFVVPVNMETGVSDTDQTKNKIEHLPLVKKKSGSPVQSDIFLNSDRAMISGLLFSPHHIGNVCQLGPFKDLEIIANGFAKNKIKPKPLEGIRYIWAEVDEEKSQYQVLSDPETK